jgi:hypothetical protein
MQAEPELSKIQAWLHTFVVEPGRQADALHAAEMKSGFQEGSAEELILPSPTLQPRERIQIYRDMYLLRMREALEVDFPLIQQRVGEHTFRDLVDRYVQSHPSQSYTLDHLGCHFASFLGRQGELAEAALMEDLARLEWSLCEVALAPDSTTLSMADLSVVAPDRFVEIRLHQVPALQTLSFRYNVNEVYKAWNEQTERPSITEQDTRLVVWRHHLNLWRLELSSAQFDFLSHLNSGLNLGHCLDQTIEAFSIEEEQLFEWFQSWIAEGFFASFTLSQK